MTSRPRKKRVQPQAVVPTRYRYDDPEYVPRMCATWYDDESIDAARGIQAEYETRQALYRDEFRYTQYTPGYQVHYTKIGCGTKVIDTLGNTLLVLDDHCGLVHKVQLVKGTPSEKSKFAFNWDRALLPGKDDWKDVVGPTFIVAR